MAYVYILHSTSAKAFQVGSCIDLTSHLPLLHYKEYKSKDRLNKKDWEMLYSIPGLSYQQAKKIEQHLKKIRNKTSLLNLFKYPELVLKLKEKYKP